MKTSSDWQFAPATKGRSSLKSPLWVRLVVVLTVLNLLAVVAAPLAKLYLQLPGVTAFRIFFIALQTGAVLGALGLVLVVVFAFSKNRPAIKSGLTMLLLGLLPVAVVVVINGTASITSPMIHDITTDTADPPQFYEVKKIRASKYNPADYGGAEIATLQKKAYPDLKPIISSMNTDDALTEATQVVKDLGWEFINIDYDKGVVEAYDTSKFFGLIDDIVIRIRREGSGSRIDVRSSSRIGQWDFGKNAQRVRLVLKTYRP